MRGAVSFSYATRRFATASGLSSGRVMTLVPQAAQSSPSRGGLVVTWYEAPHLGQERRAQRRCACVPLPAPGAPRRIKFRCADMSLGPGAGGDAAADAGAARAGEAFVVSRDEVRLDLLDRVERHADDDEEAGAAEGEGD